MWVKRERDKCESEEGVNVSEQIERARKRGLLSEREREKCECGEKWKGKEECKRIGRGEGGVWVGKERKERIIVRNKSERKRRVIGEREDCELGDREKLREKGKECEWERGGGRVWVRRE